MCLEISMKDQFKDKIAIVTGATQGLGAAVAKLFASRGAKAIVICGRRKKEGQTIAKEISNGSSSEVLFVQADVAKVADCKKVVDECVAKFKKIDILVNVAATTDRGTILNTSEELFDRMFNTNVKGPFFMIQNVAKVMRKEKIQGSIINIGSVAALAGQPFITAYCASKGAVDTLTKNVAFALMPDQIRVNCLNIGWMNTEGEDAIQKKYHGASDNWLDEAKAKMPFKRLLDPEEVAKVVAFLASDESGMMTGSAIYFDQTVPGAFMSQPIADSLVD